MSLFSERFSQTRFKFASKSSLGLTVLLLGFSLGLFAAASFAADDPAKPDEKSDADTKIPPPEEIDLSTADGLEMKATYFPGTKGEESVPVILLHGFKRNRKDFTEDGGLASILQEQLGCAVIVPDLRGHGESTKIMNGSRAEKLEAAKLRPQQFGAMVKQDLRAVKDFLWKKNNAKALNIDKLAVIGVDMGAAVGLGYAADDAGGYEQQTPRVGPLKLGEFIKVLVFISPNTDVKGLTLTQLKQQYPGFAGIFQRLAVMTLVGNKGKEQFSEAQKLSALFEKARPSEAELKIKMKTVLFLPKIVTSLQGEKLLADPSLKLPEKIVYFLKMRLVENPKAKEEWTWKERKLPHE